MALVSVGARGGEEGGRELELDGREDSLVLLLFSVSFCASATGRHRARQEKLTIEARNMAVDLPGGLRKPSMVRRLLSLVPLP